MVIDTHAHISTTEVIGLLGGTYSYGSRRLKVLLLRNSSLTEGLLDSCFVILFFVVEI